MNAITLDFWGVAAIALLAGVAFIVYRFAWRVAHFSESVISSLVSTGMPALARTLLVLFIGYNEQTYQRSRFIVWNRVRVRFFVLWGATFFLTGLIFLLRVRPVVWLPLAGLYIVYRLVTLWLNPPKPPIQTSDPALKQLIQDVNEPLRSSYRARPTRPVIRQWDYLDELFAE